MDHYYCMENSNVHRGVHHLSTLATAAYEDARRKVTSFTVFPLFWKLHIVIIVWHITLRYTDRGGSLSMSE